MWDRKARKVWRLSFLVPLPTQPSLQAAGFASQGSQTQMCIPSPKNSTVPSSPASLWVLSSAVVFLVAITSGGLMRFPIGNPSAQPLHCGWFCSAPASRAMLPWVLISDLTVLSKTTFAWESSKENTGAPGSGFKVQSWHYSLSGTDLKPVKSRGFLSPMNFNRAWTRANMVFSLYLRAGARQHCTPTSPGGFGEVLLLLQHLFSGSKFQFI